MYNGPYQNEKEQRVNRFAIYIYKNMCYPGADPGFLEREFICIKVSGGSLC